MTDASLTRVPEQTADGTLVAARGVSKWFGATRALADVTMDVRPGEIHALAGANGCGKSTLVKVLSGVERPELGEVVHGIDEAGHSVAIGTVHQELGLFTRATVAENLFGLRRGWLLVPRREEERAHGLLRQVGARFPARASVLDLSVEERALVAVARALVATRNAARSVLIVDEVTSVLRGMAARRFTDALGRLRDLGMGILFISHDLDEVLAVADRITVLRDGRVQAELRPAETGRDELIQLMTGAVLADQGDRQAGRATSRPLALEVRGLMGALVAGIDIEVRSGEVVGCTGVGGSGYEELPYLVVGDAERRHGHVRVGAVEVSSPAAFARAGGRIIPADRNRTAIAAAGTVLENFMLDHRGGHSSFGLLRARHERRVVEAAVRDYGVKCASLDAPMTSLSGGNQQKLILARCLESQPRLLVVHEPTQGVDVHARAELLALLHAAVRERGLGVLYVSGELEEVWENCHRVAVVRRGRVAGELDPARDDLRAAHDLLY